MGQEHCDWTYTINSHAVNSATYCISYGLLRASHSRNPTGIRTSVPLARHFVLIPVAFEIAYSLLRALRVRRSCLRFRRAYTVNPHAPQAEHHNRYSLYSENPLYYLLISCILIITAYKSVIFWTLSPSVN